MAESESTLDEIPELILDNDSRVKAAFDPHVASLTLRPKTNNPTDGFILAASAFFGTENVRIPIDRGADLEGSEREVFEFRFEMFQAELVLEPARCEFDCMFDVDRSIEAPISVSKIETVDNRKKKTKVKLDSGTMLEEMTGAKIGVEHEVEGKRYNPPDAWYEATIIDDKTIKFTSMGKKPVPLQGRLLDEFLGWRVVPNPNISSGVLGRLRTRESWIELTHPKPVGRIGEWSKSLFELLKGKGQRYEFRRKAFNMLLSHLVAKGLQEGSETRDATLSADTVIVLPSGSDFKKLATERRKNTLDFSDHPIAEFLKSPKGSEKAILQQFGVSQTRIEALGLPPSPQDDEEYFNVDFRPLEYMIEVHVDLVMAKIKSTETKWGLLKPVVVKSILTGNPTQFISASAAKNFGLLMTKSECKALIDMARSQPNVSAHFIGKKMSLTSLKNVNGRYEVSFNELAVLLFGDDLTSSYVSKNKERIEHFISMYDGN